MSHIPSDPSTSEQIEPKPARKGRKKSPGDSLARLMRYVANWQARWAWQCAGWGLIPVAGLPLGVAACFLGIWGYIRYRRNPDDLGVRHAIGGVILGFSEACTNSIGLWCVFKGVSELTR